MIFWINYCPWAYCVGSSKNSLFVCLLSVRLSSVRPSVSRSVLDQKSAEGTRWRAGSRSKTRLFGTFFENTLSTWQFKCPACSNLEIFLHNRPKGHPCPAAVNLVKGWCSVARWRLFRAISNKSYFEKSTLPLVKPDKQSPFLWANREK